MKNKRILALILALLLTFSLVGCSNSNYEEEDDDDDVYIEKVENEKNSEKEGSGFDVFGIGSGDKNHSNDEDEHEIEENAINDVDFSKLEERISLMEETISEMAEEIITMKERIKELEGKIDNQSYIVVEDEKETDNNYDRYINEKYGYTIDNFYTDSESKLYADEIIGLDMPNVYWETSKGIKDVSSLGDRYIIEIFSPSCTYCQRSIPEVHNFAKNNEDIKVVSLTTVTGQDISAFNAYGEAAFVVGDMSMEFEEMLNYIPWIPAFLYVENGEVRLITWGGVTENDLEHFSKVAFDY